MRVIILKPCEIGGVAYRPEPTVQVLPDDIARQLIDEGNARCIDAVVPKLAEPRRKRFKIEH